MNRTHVCLNLCTVAAVSTAARPTTETNAAETNGILSVSLLTAVPTYRRLVEPSKNRLAPIESSPRRASSAKQRGKPQARVGLLPYVCIQHEARIDRRTGGHWCLRTESLIVYTQETAGAKTVTSETKAKVANYQKHSSHPADSRRYIYSCCSRLVRSLHVVLRGVHWFE